LFDPVRTTPEFKDLLSKGEDQIRKKREEVQKLEQQGLL
jgi:hypothetical protein